MVIIEVIVLLILAGAAFVMAQYNKFQTVTIEEEDIEVNEGVSEEGFTTLALFGVDSRKGDLEEGTRSDTIIVASINNETKEIKMASIYRDTLLEMEDGTLNKANAAYSFGGPAGAINTLNRNLDLAISDYVTVDFRALSDVVDLLGGVEITVSEEEAQMLNHYVHETAKAAGKEANELPGAGTYNLDGPQAVTYARLRKLEGGDYKRTERQREVIDKMFDKIMQTDLPTLTQIVDVVFPQVSTSFSLAELVKLASGVTQYHLGESAGFPVDRDDDHRYNGGSVVIPLDLTTNVQALHEFLYGKEEISVSLEVQRISQEIENETGVYPVEEKTEDAYGESYGDEAAAGDTYGTGNTQESTYGTYESEEESGMRDSDSSENSLFIMPDDG